MFSSYNLNVSQLSHNADFLWYDYDILCNFDLIIVLCLSLTSFQLFMSELWDLIWYDNYNLPKHDDVFSKVLEMDFHIKVLHAKNIALKQLLLVADECRNALQIQDKTVILTWKFTFNIK